MRLKILVSVVALAPVLATAGPINLDLVTVYQQQANSPCVIGNPSCSQGGFIYNSWTSTPGGTQGSTYDLYSPVYIVGAALGTPSTIPQAFSIGIDINVSAGWGDEQLVFFKTWDCGSDPTCGSPSPDSSNSWELGPTAIGLRNGNGYSDAVLMGFGLILGNYYKFEASMSNDTDGMEQFFLIPAGSPPSEIPEPATAALMGGGLLALVLALRRRKQA